MTKHVLTKVRRILRRKQTQKRLGVVLSLVFFAVAAAYLLVLTFAATSTVNIQPENGTASGAATVGSDANASNGKFVQLDIPTATASWPARDVKSTLGFFANGTATSTGGGPKGSDNWLGRDAKYWVRFTARTTPSAMVTNFNHEVLNNVNGNRTIVISLPLGFDNSGACGSSKPRSVAVAKMNEVANGNFDSSWQAIATTIKNNNLTGRFPDGRPKLIMRLGWESNGSWYCWSTVNESGATASSDAFKKAYRHVHDTINKAINASSPNSVDLTWVYALATGGSYNAIAAAYPGDDYIDVVELDIYDNSYLYLNAAKDSLTPLLSKWPEVWNQKLNQSSGLNRVLDFAKSKNKLFAIGEWGVWTTTTIEKAKSSGALGGGDHPEFIQAMHDWLKPVAEQGLLAYHSMFDADASQDGALHRLSNNSHPNSAAKFKQLFK